MFELKIDDDQVFYKENKKAKVFWKVDGYVGDPWYPVANGWIADFIYETE